MGFAGAAACHQDARRRMLQERWQQAQLTAIPDPAASWLRLPARKRTRFVLRSHGQRDRIVDHAELLDLRAQRGLGLGLNNLGSQEPREVDVLTVRDAVSSAPLWAAATAARSRPAPPAETSADRRAERPR